MRVDRGSGARSLLVPYRGKPFLLDPSPPSLPIDGPSPVVMKIAAMVCGECVLRGRHLNTTFESLSSGFGASAALWRFVTPTHVLVHTHVIQGWYSSHHSSDRDKKKAARDLAAPVFHGAPSIITRSLTPAPSETPSRVLPTVRRSVASLTAPG